MRGAARAKHRELFGRRNVVQGGGYLVVRDKGEVTRFCLSSINCLSSRDGLKVGTKCSPSATASPVRGLRAIRGLRFFVRNVPNPRISMWSPLASASAMVLKK